MGIAPLTHSIIFALWLALLAIWAIAATRARRNNTVLAWIGVAICALGVGLAIAARVQLGRNWGMPASRTENPDLITAGPYRFIRLPIYAGLMRPPID